MTYQRVIFHVAFLCCCILLLTCSDAVESSSAEIEADSKFKAAQDTESKTVTSSSTSSIHHINDVLKPSQIRNKRSNSLLDTEQLNGENVGLNSAFLYSDQIMQNLLKTQSPKPLSYARSNFFLNLLKPRATRYNSWDEHSLMHFGKRSSDTVNDDYKDVVKRSTDYWSPNNVMHFGKKSDQNYQTTDEIYSPTLNTNEILDFRTDMTQEIPGVQNGKDLENSMLIPARNTLENKEIPIEETDKKSSDPWHNMMSFGKRFENDWEHNTLHFGKRQDPWHNMMSFGKRSENPWNHNTLHFGKKDEPWHNMMSFGKRFENPWDHNTLHFGKRDEPWHNMMSFGKRSENPWDHNTLHFGKRDEPWHNMMSFGKRSENPWDHSTLHFGKRDVPWHNMMSFGKRFENPWDHNTLHFGKRDEPWHNMMSFGKKSDNPWDHNTLHFGKRDDPWHNMMSFGKKSEPWHNIMSFGKKSESSWDNITKEEEKRDDPWHNMMSFGKKSADDFGDHFTLHFGKREEPWHNMMSFGKKSENLWDHNTLHFGKKDEPWHNIMSFGKKSDYPWTEHSTLHFGKRNDPWHNIMSFGKRQESKIEDDEIEDIGPQINPWNDYDGMVFYKRFDPWDHSTLHFGKRSNASIDSKESETNSVDSTNSKHIQKRSIDAWDNPHTMHFGKKSDPWDMHNTMHFGKKSDSRDFETEMDIDKKYDWDHNTLHFGKKSDPWDAYHTMHFGKKSSPWDHNTMHFGKRDPWDYHNTMHFGKRDPWDYHNTMHFGKRDPWDYHNTMHFGKRDPWDYHNTMHFGKKRDPWDYHNTMHFGKRANSVSPAGGDMIELQNRNIKTDGNELKPENTVSEQDTSKNLELNEEERNKLSVQKRSTDKNIKDIKSSMIDNNFKKNVKEISEYNINSQENIETPLQKTRQSKVRTAQENYKNGESITKGSNYLQNMQNKPNKDSNGNAGSTGALNSDPTSVHENRIHKRSLKSTEVSSRNALNFPAPRLQRQILKNPGLLELEDNKRDDDFKFINQKNTKNRINKRSVDIHFKKIRDNENSDNIDPNIEPFDDYSKEEFPDTVLHFGKRSLDGTEGDILPKESENIWAIDDKRSDDFWNSYNTMHFGKRNPWDYHNTMHFGKRDPWDYHNTMHFGKRDPWDYHNTMHFGKRNPWDFHNTMHFGKRDPWDYHNTLHFGKKFDPWDGPYKMHFGKRSSNWDHGLMHFGKRKLNSDDIPKLPDILSSTFDQEMLLDENTAKQLLNDLRLNILSHNPNNEQEELLDSLENLEYSIVTHLKDKNVDVATKLNILRSYLRPILEKILSEEAKQGSEIKNILPASEEYFEDGIPEVSAEEKAEDDYETFDNSKELPSKSIISDDTKHPLERNDINHGKLPPRPELIEPFEDNKGKRNYLGKPELKRYFVPFQGPKSIVYPHAWFASQIRKSQFPKSPEYTRSIQLKMAEKKEDPFNSYMHFGR